jgi:hypothetical protein
MGSLLDQRKTSGCVGLLQTFVFYSVFYVFILFIRSFDLNNRDEQAIVDCDKNENELHEDDKDCGELRSDDGDIEETKTR